MIRIFVLLPGAVLLRKTFLYCQITVLQQLSYEVASPKKIMYA
jgi:hypothetical protein